MASRFDSFMVNDTDSLLPGSVGPRVGFFEGLSLGFEQQYKVDSYYSFEGEAIDRWKQSLEDIRKANGQVYNMSLDLDAMTDYAKITQGQDVAKFPIQGKLEDLAASVALGPVGGAIARRLTKPNRETDIANFKKANEAAKTLGVKSFEDIIKEVMAERKAIEQRSAAAGETASVGGTIGEFIGAMAGSFTSRDPLLVATLPVGGFGRSIAQKIVTEALTIGAVEAGQQFAGVEPTRELLGEKPGSPWESVGYAMAGAGLLRGGFEGLGRLLGRASESAAERVEAENIRLRETIQAMPESPSKTAAAHLLETNEAIERVNPYGESIEGSRRFIAELSEVRKVMAGEPATAIAQALPEVPINVHLLDADSALVQAEAPEVYGRLVNAQAKLQEVDARINEVEQSVEGLSLPDAIARIDEDTANLARSYEKDLENPQLPEPKRQEIQRKLDIIVESLGAENILREAQNAAIAPRKELQTARQSRKAAAKEFRKARQEFDRALADIQARQRVKSLMELNKTGRLVEAAIKTDGQPLGDMLRHDTIEAAVQQTKEVSEAIPEQAKKIVNNSAEVEPKNDLPPIKKGMIRVWRGGEPGEQGRGGWYTTSRQYAEQHVDKNGGDLWYADISRNHSMFSNVIDGQGPEQGFTFSADFAPTEIKGIKVIEEEKFDIGAERLVPGSFVIRSLDADGNEVAMTVKEIMQDLKEDIDLEEAMKVCSL